MVSSMKCEKPLRETVPQYRIGIRKYAAAYIPLAVQSTVNLLLRPRRKMQTAKGTAEYQYNMVKQPTVLNL